jgi:hypothetical protein
MISNICAQTYFDYSIFFKLDNIKLYVIIPIRTLYAPDKKVGVGTIL